MSVKGDAIVGLDTPVIVEDDGDDARREKVDTFWAILHAAGFLGVILVTLVFLAWVFASLGKKCEIAREKYEWTLLALALGCGAIGGLVHAITSFTTFAGNRQLVRSWLPWLYLRAPVGSLLAFIVYLGFRAGIFGDGKLKGCPDVFTVAMAAALAGLFSKQAADKLADVVDNLLTPSKRPERSDKLPEKTTSGAITGVAYSETIQQAQRRLIELGHLPQLGSDGRPNDDGLLDDETRTAVERFLDAQDVTAADRERVLGMESAPDYWPRLLVLLDEVAQNRPNP